MNPEQKLPAPFSAEIENMNIDDHQDIDKKLSHLPMGRCRKLRNRTCP